MDNEMPPETAEQNKRHRQNHAAMFERYEAGELRPARDQEYLDALAHYSTTQEGQRLTLRPAPVPADDAGEDAPDTLARLAAVEQSVRALATSDSRTAAYDADEQRRLALLEAAIKDSGADGGLIERLKSRRLWVTVLSGGGLVIGALQQAFAGDPRWSGFLGTLATVIASVYVYAQSGEDKAKAIAAGAVQQTRIAALAAPASGAERMMAVLRRRE